MNLTLLRNRKKAANGGQVEKEEKVDPATTLQAMAGQVTKPTKTN